MNKPIIIIEDNGGVISAFDSNLNKVEILSNGGAIQEKFKNTHSIELRIGGVCNSCADMNQKIKL